MLDRRQFGLGLAALPLVLRASTRPRIVVVGAGVGGLAFVAALRRRLPAEAVELHMVEPRPHYSAPFGTARALCGESHTLRLAYPVSHVAHWHHERVQALDPVARQLRLSNRQSLSYDFLLLAPGLEATEPLPGADHLAWFNDDSFEQLQRRLSALPRRASIVLTVPHLPYRCPPAPYERAGLLLQQLQRQGRDDVRISVLDAKESFALQAHILSDWERRWPGRIEWFPPSVHDGIEHWDERGADTGLGRFEADLIHAIPAQQAPAWCRRSGLADFTGYCPVTLPGFRSTSSERIYIVGDAAKAGEMPKAASAALVQADQAAADLAARLGARKPSPAPALRSTCYLRLGPGEAVVSNSRFDVTGAALAEEISPYPLQSDNARAAYLAAENWYRYSLQALGLATNSGFESRSPQPAAAS